MARHLSNRTRYTPRLTLRPFRRRDLESMLEAVIPSLEELSTWMPWARHSYGRRDALLFLRDSLAAWAEGRAYDFSIRYQADQDRHLGNVSVWYTSRQSRVGEIGYWIRTDEAGKGIATEAAAHMLDIAFNELDLHRVTLRIAAGNIGSERVAEKLGFEREGLLREELEVGGVWLDHSIWGLLDHEYRSRRNSYVEAGFLEA